MMFVVPPPPPFNKDEPRQGASIFADIPLGDKPLEYYKKIAASILAQHILDLVEPEFIEAEGYEVMRYSVVIVRNGDDGRNDIKIPK